MTRLCIILLCLLVPSVLSSIATELCATLEMKITGKSVLSGLVRRSLVYCCTLGMLALIAIGHLCCIQHGKSHIIDVQKRGIDWEMFHMQLMSMKLVRF